MLSCVALGLQEMLAGRQGGREVAGRVLWVSEERLGGLGGISYVCVCVCVCVFVCVCVCVCDSSLKLSCIALGLQELLAGRQGGREVVGVFYGWRRND